MYGTANFAMPKQDPAILVSRTSFVGGVNSNQIYVMENNTAKVRKVVAGRIYGDKVEIPGRTERRGNCYHRRPDQPDGWFRK